MGDIRQLALAVAAVVVGLGLQLSGRIVRPLGDVISLACLWVFAWASLTSPQVVAYAKASRFAPAIVATQYAALLAAVVVLVVFLFFSRKALRRDRWQWPLKPPQEPAVMAAPLQLRPTIEFYEDRSKYQDIRGGVRADLKACEEMWIAWATGRWAASDDLFRSEKITRVMLFSPHYSDLKVYASVAGFQGKTHRENILESTEVLRKEQERGDRARLQVRWMDGPMTFLTICDPTKPNAWARVEDYFSSTGRPSYIVYRKDHKELFGEILKYYNAIFAMAKEPPNDIRAEPVP